MADIVTSQNAELYRRAFAQAQGHDEECIKETVNDMANIIAKVCDAFGEIPVEEILEQLTVEQFDQCLKKILANKDCKCSKEPRQH